MQGSRSRVQRLTFQRVFNMQRIVIKIYRANEFCSAMGTYVTYRVGTEVMLYSNNWFY